LKRNTYVFFDELVVIKDLLLFRSFVGVSEGLERKLSSSSLSLKVSGEILYLDI
jgi:hypothetical protein